MRNHPYRLARKNASALRKGANRKVRLGRSLPWTLPTDRDPGARDDNSHRKDTVPGQGPPPGRLSREIPGCQKKGALTSGLRPFSSQTFPSNGQPQPARNPAGTGAKLRKNRASFPASFQQDPGPDPALTRAAAPRKIHNTLKQQQLFKKTDPAA